MNTRRLIAIGLLVLGGVLIFFATDTVAGAVLIALALLIEIVGIYLERRR